MREISTRINRSREEKNTYRLECPDNVDSHLLVVKFQKKLKRKKRKRKTYKLECPDNVDLHSNVPVESMPQIRTVLSSLPLASVPSMLHATDNTL